MTLENIQPEAEFSFSETEAAFGEAMKKRHYDEALDKLSLILGNLGEEKLKKPWKKPWTNALILIGFMQKQLTILF